MFKSAEMNEESSGSGKEEHAKESQFELQGLETPEWQSVLKEKKTPEKITQKQSHTKFRQVFLINSEFFSFWYFFSNARVRKVESFAKSVVISFLIPESSVLFDPIHSL